MFFGALCTLECDCRRCRGRHPQSPPRAHSPWRRVFSALPRAHRGQRWWKTGKASPRQPNKHPGRRIEPKSTQGCRVGQARSRGLALVWHLLRGPRACMACPTRHPPRARPHSAGEQCAASVERPGLRKRTTRNQPLLRSSTRGSSASRAAGQASLSSYKLPRVLRNPKQ